MIQTLPMTIGQQGLWYLARTGDDVSAAHNVVMAFRASSALDAHVLESAMARVVRRHPLLAARIAEVDYVPRLICDPELLAPVRRESGSLEAFAYAESGRSIDMAAGPLYRVAIVDGEDGACGLVLTVHHIVFDGTSAAILMDEIGRCSRAPFLDAASSWSLKTHVEREAAFLSSPAGTARVARLASALADVPAREPLPTIASAERYAAAPAGQFSTPLAPATTAAVRAFASRRGITSSAVYLAAFIALVWQYGRQRDVIVSLPVDARSPESDGEIGYLVNLAILRAAIDGTMSAGDLSDQVADRLFDLVESSDVPYPTLVRALKGDREILAETMLRLAFNYQPQPRETWNVGGVELRPVRLPAKFAKGLLKLEIEELADGGYCTLVYDQRAFEDGVSERLAAHYVPLLEAFVEAPARLIEHLPVLSDEEHDRMVGQAVDAPGSPAVETLVEEHARRTPDAMAVICGPNRLSYSELDARAEQLAATLRAWGVGPDVRVAMCLGREIDRIVVMLGVAKAGGACLPVDPDAPDERLRFIIEDSAALVVLSRASEVARFSGLGARVSGVQQAIDAAPATPPGGRGVPHPANLAYCIYTSGSTGRPKGVDVPRAALANLIAWHLATSGTVSTDRFLQANNIVFDSATWEVWGTLCAGATLVVMDEAVVDPAEIARYMVVHAITTTCLVTPLAEAFITADHGQPLLLRTLHTGGDRLHFGPRDDAYEVANHYGPTECSVISTSARIPAGLSSAPSIGRPVTHARAYVLDSKLRLMPPGATGELYLAGPGVARGYCRRPGLTAERFMPDPHGLPGQRMYRTGDLARWRIDGELDFIGRSDWQVKLRGYRIELGEIESVLLETPGVSEAAVGVQQDERGVSHLVAWIATAQEGSPLMPADLSQELLRRVPNYMVPAAWLILPTLPKGGTGKVDRLALPAVPLRSDSTSVEAAATATETWLAEIWKEVLSIERLGRDDNFFALGGHSLLATQIVARASARLGRRISLRTLLDCPTVAMLGAALDATRSDEPDRADPPPIVRRAAPAAART